ncbi:MAG: hypothetical protein HYV26_01205 [Candidatus Hydrogenedentes bacterium]|nr:hypothetical protein [Candidatus Hydrogenedentota bacterium]MBI3119233.1 hypothetical protein [Candidatus Hydrogenedentota bacterium]
MEHLLEWRQQDLEVDVRLAHVRRTCLLWELWRVPFNTFLLYFLLWKWGIEVWFSHDGGMFLLFLAVNLYFSLGCLAELYAFAFLRWRWCGFRHVIVVGQALLLGAVAWNVL